MYIPDRTADAAIYTCILSGQTPNECEIHKRTLGALSDSVERRLAERQRLVKGEKSKK